MVLPSEYDTDREGKEVELLCDQMLILIDNVPQSW